MERVNKELGVMRQRLEIVVKEGVSQGEEIKKMSKKVERRVIGRKEGGGDDKEEEEEQQPQQ